LLYIGGVILEMGGRDIDCCNLGEKFGKGEEKKE
jgi:hypothetical protein